ncbi:polysaccharide pyruvyl transferase family protein, partial [Zavarzinia sp.]|uniref:polysaccharide pyruvyl transferase family protein n=1 Tax=Zavarzinia sp. TaxID=2027920 RepID=UPI003BB79537
VLLRLESPRAVPVEAPPALPSVRPIVVIAGFYGRGNCGDEALFQTIYETFAPDFDVIVAVDSFGAVDGFQHWYPYNRCEIRHQCDLDMFDEGRPIAAMMIGGGGLAVGFAANLVFEARARGIPTFISGVDLPGLDMPGCDPPDRQVVHGRRVIDAAQMKAYLGGFSRVMVRTRHGLDICRQLGVEADYGADWAIRLIQDEAEDVADSSRRALIVLREFPLHLVPYSYVLEIQALVDGLKAQGWHPAFLPFCPEDARNTAELGLDSLAPTFEHWWNPRRVKQLISASGLVIGVGRLHPLIFAASLGVPTVSLVPPLRLPSGRKSITKIDAVCADWGLAQFATVPELLAATEGPLKGVSSRKLAAAQGRLERSITGMMDIIARYRAANSI